MARKPALRPHIGLLLRGAKSPAYPEPGYFRLRQRRGAPWIPARIWAIDHEPGDPDNILDTGPILIASIGEDAADPLMVWERGNRIDEEEYRWRLALREWVITFAPEEPEARPRDRADLSKLPSLF